MLNNFLENKESKNKYPLGARIRDGLSNVFTAENIKDVLKVGVVGGVMLFADEVEAKDNPTSLNNSLNPSKPSSLNLSGTTGVNNMTFEEYNKLSNDNNGIESVAEDTVKVDPYLFPGEINYWGRWQEVYFDGLVAPLQANVTVTFNGTVTDVSTTNPLKFKLNVDQNNTGGMYKITINVTDANNVQRQIVRDVEIIENSNPYPALESGVPLKGTLSTRPDYEGWTMYECVPAEWVVRYNKLGNFNLSSYIRGADIETMMFSQMNATLTGPGSTIYIKYAPNATDKLVVLVVTDNEDLQSPNGGGGIRGFICDTPTLIELQDSILATTLNLNMGRVPIGNTVITSFNTGTEPDVTLRKVINGEVLDSKHIPFVDLIQDEILIKPEYAQGDSHYVPLTYTVDNGHSQIVFTIDAYDPTTVGVEDELGDVPTEFKLEQNYPNPFNPSTTVGFTLPERCHVSANIVNILGQNIKNVINGDVIQGQHSQDVNMSNLPSGIYLYTFHAKGESGKIYSKTIKMNLVK